MKKIITAFIAILYMGLSSGIAMELHYCMGKKAGVDFFVDNDGKCGKCGMTEKKSGCCSDEHKFIKINDSHKNVSNEVVIGIPAIAILHTYIGYQQYFLFNAATSKFQNNSPPEYTRPSACIMNCVFRL